MRIPLSATVLLAAALSLCIAPSAVSAQVHEVYRSIDGGKPRIPDGELLNIELAVCYQSLENGPLQGRFRVLGDETNYGFISHYPSTDEDVSTSEVVLPSASYAISDVRVGDNANGEDTVSLTLTVKERLGPARPLYDAPATSVTIDLALYDVSSEENAADSGIRDLSGMYCVSDKEDGPGGGTWLPPFSAAVFPTSVVFSSQWNERIYFETLPMPYIETSNTPKRYDINHIVRGYYEANDRSYSGRITLIYNLQDDNFRGHFISPNGEGTATFKVATASTGEEYLEGTYAFTSTRSSFGSFALSAGKWDAFAVPEPPVGALDGGMQWTEREWFLGLRQSADADDAATSVAPREYQAVGIAGGRVKLCTAAAGGPVFGYYSTGSGAASPSSGVLFGIHAPFGNASHADQRPHGDDYVFLYSRSFDASKIGTGVDEFGTSGPYVLSSLGYAVPNYTAAPGEPRNATVSPALPGGITLLYDPQTVGAADRARNASGSDDGDASGENSAATEVDPTCRRIHDVGRPTGLQMITGNRTTSNGFNLHICESSLGRYRGFLSSAGALSPNAIIDLLWDPSSAKYTGSYRSPIGYGTIEITASPPTAEAQAAAGSAAGEWGYTLSASVTLTERFTAAANTAATFTWTAGQPTSSDASGALGLFREGDPTGFCAAGLEPGPEMDGTYTTEYGETISFCRVDVSTYQAEYSSATYNGLIPRLVWDHSVRAYRGRWFSQNGAGAATFTVKDGSLVGTYSFAESADSRTFTEDAGSWNAEGSTRVGLGDNHAICGGLTEAARLGTIKGVYTSIVWGEAVTICTDADEVAGLLSGSYMGATTGAGFYNGLFDRLVFHPSTRTWSGRWSSHNGRGSVTFGRGDPIEFGGDGGWSLLGTYSFTTDAGDTAFEATDSWDMGTVSNYVDESRECRTVPEPGAAGTISGRFRTEWNETMDVCTLSRGTAQAEYAGPPAAGADSPSYTGYSFLVYYPPLASWIGTFASSNGHGRAVFTMSEASPVTFSGTYAFIETMGRGFETSPFADPASLTGSWALGTRDSARAVPEPGTSGLCAEVPRGGAALEGVFRSNFGEEMHFCQISRDLVQVEYHGDGYSGLMILAPRPGARRAGGWEGVFASANGVGTAFFSSTGSSGAFAGGWRFTRSLNGRFLSTGAWNPGAKGAAAVAPEICAPIATTAGSPTGAFTSEYSETWLLCSPRVAGIVRGEYAAQDGSYNGLFPQLVFSPSRGTYSGTWTSQNGAGTATLALPTASSAAAGGAVTGTYTATELFTSSVTRSGTWNAQEETSVTAGITVGEGVCSPAPVPGEAEALSGWYTTEFGENMTLCTRSAGVATGDYLGNGYAGVLTRLHYRGSTQTWTGHWFSGNGRGTASFGPTAAVGEPAGTLRGEWAFTYVANVSYPTRSGSWNPGRRTMAGPETCPAPASTTAFQGVYGTADGAASVSACGAVSVKASPGLVQAEYVRTVTSVAAGAAQLPNGTSVPAQVPSTTTVRGVLRLVGRPSAPGTWVGTYTEHRGGDHGITTGVASARLSSAAAGAVVLELTGASSTSLEAGEALLRLTLTRQAHARASAQICVPFRETLAQFTSVRTTEWDEEMQLCQTGEGSVSGQYVSSSADGYNGLIEAVLVPSRGEIVGTFVSQNGYGTASFAVGADGALTGSFTFTSSENFFSTGSGSWNAGSADATAAPHPAVCAGAMTSVPSIAGGRWTTEFGEALSMCAGPHRGLTIGDYSTSTYNGVLRLVAIPSEGRFAGTFSSTNGGGRATFALVSPSSAGTSALTGTWEFTAGAFEGTGTGSWNTGARAAGGAAAWCSAPASVPRAAGVFQSNFAETVTLCQPSFGVLQGTYSAATYSGRARLVYSFSRGTFSGRWASPNGDGGVVWTAGSGSAGGGGDLTGSYTTINSFNGNVADPDGGTWNLERQLDVVSNHASCATVILTTSSSTVTLRLEGNVESFPRSRFIAELAKRISVDASRVELVRVESGSVLATVRVRDEPGSRGEDALRPVLTEDLAADPIPGFQVLSTAIEGSTPVTVAANTPTPTATAVPSPAAPNQVINNVAAPTIPEDGDDGLSTGEIVLIVFACLCFVGIVISIFSFLRYRSDARDATLEAQAAQQAARSIPPPAPTVNYAPPQVNVTHVDREPHSEIPAATKKLFEVYGPDDPKIVPHLQSLYERDPAAVISAVPEQHVSLLVKQLDAPGRQMPRLVRDVSAATHRSSGSGTGNRI